jgi:hypothetical protein
MNMTQMRPLHKIRESGEDSEQFPREMIRWEAHFRRSKTFDSEVNDWSGARSRHDFPTFAPISLSRTARRIRSFSAL